MAAAVLSARSRMCRSIASFSGGYTGERSLRRPSEDRRCALLFPVGFPLLFAMGPRRADGSKMTRHVECFARRYDTRETCRRRAQTQLPNARAESGRYWHGEIAH